MKKRTIKFEKFMQFKFSYITLEATNIDNNEFDQRDKTFI